MAINQLKTGVVLSYVSIGINTLIGLLLVPFILRMLGQAEYGLYSLVASIIAYLSIFDSGFGNAIIRYTAKFRKTNKEREQHEMFGMFILLYSAIGVVILIAGLAFYFNIDNLYGNTMTVDELRKTRIMVFMTIVNLAVTFPLCVWGSIITAYENFIFQKLVLILRTLLNAAAIIVMLLFGFKAIGIVACTIAFNILALVANWWFCKYRLQIKVIYGKFNWSFMKEVALYTFWIFLNLITDRIYWSTGQVILGIYYQAAIITVYALAIQLVQIYMTCSTAISGVFLPKLTGMVAQEKSHKVISDLFIRTGRLQYCVIVFILTGFVLFGKQFITLWAGDGFADVYYLGLMLFVPLTVPLVQNLGITILQAYNKMAFRCVLYVVIAVLSLVLSLLLIPQYGVYGCALGTTIALILGQIIIMNVYYQKKIKLDIILFWKEIGKMTIAPLFIGAIGWYTLQYIPLNNVGALVLGMLAFSAVYLPAFWFFAMNKYERGLIITPLTNALNRTKA